MKLHGTRTPHHLRLAAALFLALLPIFALPGAAAAAGLTDALFADADFYAQFRYRYEHVEDDLAARDANASTLRSVLGYRSGVFHGFSFLLEGEQVSRIFSGDYFEGFGANSTGAATVVDPDGTELNQGYLQYAAPGASLLRIGRQVITYRDAPFHRFIGNILWRQNWQTFDAVSLQNAGLPDTRLSYAYVWNVNRIFGDDAPGALSDFDSDSHFFNARNTRFALANVEGYGYLLDFENAPALSSQTWGLRLQGRHPLTDVIAPVYALEYAWQTDYGANPDDYSESYQLAEAGLELKPAAVRASLLLKASFERLGGDGQRAFQTPLGTNHAFQGTADRFLLTPADGIRDYYLSSVITAFGFKFAAAYHIFDSDRFDYRFGEELDLELTRPVGERFLLGIKYADYDADANSTNLLRNGFSTVSADARKFWLYVTAEF